MYFLRPRAARAGLDYEFPISGIGDYERIEAPDGLLVAGDALCSFNPIYGQGMSAALLEVDALARLLDGPRRRREHRGEGAAGRARGRYFAAAAQVIATPWRLAASADFQYPETTGERPEQSEERGLYLLALNEIAIEDVEVNRALAEVFQLVRPMSDLDAEPLRSRGRERMKTIAERSRRRAPSVSRYRLGSHRSRGRRRS